MSDYQIRRDEEPEADRPLAQKLIHSSPGERLRMVLMPSLLLFLVIGAAFYSTQRQLVRDEKTHEALVALSTNLPDSDQVDRLRANVDQIVRLIPPSALAPVKECKPNSEGPSQQTCTERPSSSGALVAATQRDLTSIARSLGHAIAATRDMRELARSESFLSAYAYAPNGNNDWPSTEDRRFIMYAAFSILIIMTLGCFGVMLVSSNSRAVTYAIDALKVFGGFYVGVVGSVFGLRR